MSKIEIINKYRKKLNVINSLFNSLWIKPPEKIEGLLERLEPKLQEIEDLITKEMK